MKIRVGSTDYELKLGNPEEVIQNKDDDAVFLGGVDFRGAKIIIDENDLRQVKLQSFWHELLHSFLEELGLYELNNDEGFIDSLAKQIYMFFRDNKIDKIYEYLGDENKRK